MLLTYRRMKKSEKSYAVQLAQDEINIEPKRLDEYNTYLIYDDSKKIGFVSFGFRPDQSIYIYIIAFEKDAQRQGFASEVFESVIKYGRKKSDHFRGLRATVHKVNDPAIRTAYKYGFFVTREREKYLDLFKPETS